jgi:hypothetical protein
VITQERIEQLASRKGVRRIAVENFLASLGSSPSKQAALMNLGEDARMYKWNAATVSAIRTGIGEAFR